MAWEKTVYKVAAMNVVQIILGVMPKWLAVNDIIQQWTPIDSLIVSMLTQLAILRVG